MITQLRTLKLTITLSTLLVFGMPLAAVAATQLVPISDFQAEGGVPELTTPRLVPANEPDSTPMLDCQAVRGLTLDEAVGASLQAFPTLAVPTTPVSENGPFQISPSRCANPTKWLNQTLTLGVPAHLARFKEGTPVRFTWSGSKKRATLVSLKPTYQIELSRYDFSGQSPTHLITVTRLVSGWATTFTDLPEALYKWRVRQVSHVASPKWSAHHLLIIDGTAPATPTQQLPQSGSTMKSEGLALSWGAVKDPRVDLLSDHTSPFPVVYDVQVAVTPSDALMSEPVDVFASPVVDQSGLTAPTLSLPTLPSGNYLWHVRARDAVGNTSTWSPAWNVVLDSEAPQITINDITTFTVGTDQVVSGVVTGSDVSAASARIIKNSDNSVIADWFALNLTGNAFSQTLPSLPVGTYTLEAKAQDTVGNMSPVVLKVFTVLPVVEPTPTPTSTPTPPATPTPSPTPTPSLSATPSPTSSAAAVVATATPSSTPPAASAAGQTGSTTQQIAALASPGTPAGTEATASPSATPLANVTAEPIASATPEDAVQGASTTKPAASGWSWWYLLIPILLGFILYFIWRRNEER